MANTEQESLLRQEDEGWNQWRDANPSIQPDLSGADLSRAVLISVDLSGADLSRADLSGGRLLWSDLSGANLSRANLVRADLRWVRLSGANLSGADLSRADLSGTDLSGTDLSGADLSNATCVGTELQGANMAGCSVYGVSAWSLHIDETTVQTNLRITPKKEPAITVDNLEIAQFLYLLLHSEKIRAALDTVMTKVVLILGRFSEDRLPILQALRDALQRQPEHYIPVLFDFAPQADRPVLDTVMTLANLARFIVADITDAAMVRAELAILVPNLPSVPVQPLLQEGEGVMAEFARWQRYQTVLPIYRYRDLEHLLANLGEGVIAPAEAHVQAHKL